MFVDILILAQLDARPSHGYDIKKQTQSIVFGSTYTINNNTLYPALRRFEEMGAVVREVERQTGRPDRHIYHLTDLGREVLYEMLREFPPELAVDESEFLVRVSMFERLDLETRLEILKTRQAVVGRNLNHLSQIHTFTQSEQHRDQRQALRVLGFVQGQVQHELEWIDELIRETETETPREV
ncbi:MAG: PadR family transcriptional regulator [Ktedonobacterales bacterium]